jgi:hypothetical protein
MSFKNKTSLSKKGLFNALKCALFTLKTQVFVFKKNTLWVLSSSHWLFPQKEYLFEPVKNPHFTPKNAFLLPILPVRDVLCVTTKNG